MNAIYILITLLSLQLPKRLVEIPIKTHNEVYKLGRLKITIVDAGDSYARAILDDKEIEHLKSLGYEVKVIFEDYRELSKRILEKKQYHTYEQVVQEMIEVATNYPHIATLDTIGYSVQNRLILGMKISDNPIAHENEPGIRFTGCHHGDEHIATEIVLYMIHYLTDNYSTSPHIKELVDSREIWFIPMVNPDGVYHNTRENANGVDLNRDYGYMWEGWGGSPGPFSQPETQAMRKNVLENRFVLGFDYHSAPNVGSDVRIVNTLWDYSPIYPQVDTIMMNIGKDYADSTGYELIRGWYWYGVHGSCQDAMYGCEGIIDYTIETPYPDNPEGVCESNREAILSMINRAGDIGIAGIVTDSITGAPLDARVDIKEIHWPIYTDSRLGDYHRILLPGTYTVEVSANGYLTKTIPGVTVSDLVTQLDVTLTPGGGCYAHRIVWACVADPNDAHTNRTLTTDVLGVPDDAFLSIGVSGNIVLDMGENTPITGIFTVYEGDDGVSDEGYEVLISNIWNGPFVSVGTGYGTQSFDIGIVGYDEARYVKIIDDGDGNPNTPYAGFDLDAIESKPILGPCLTYKGYLINDSGSGGNNDSIPEPGEIVGISIIIKNRGTENLSNVTGTIVTQSPYINILVDTASFGDVSAGEEDTSSTYYTLSIDSGCPTPYQPICELTLAGDGYSTTNSFSIVIGSPGFYDDMECDTLQWTHSGANDLWHITEHRYASPTHSWYCGNEGSWQYDNNMNASITSREILITSNSHLEFDHWYDTELGYDYAYLEISVNGSGWTQLDRWDGGSDGWEHETYDFTYPAGTIVQIRFRLNTDGSEVREGWYIDNVYIWPPVVAVKELKERQVKIVLFQNLPNPFTKTTVIRIKGLSSRLINQTHTLQIYDITGRLVKSFPLITDHLSLTTAVSWDGTDNLGKKVGSGVYFYQLVLDNYKLSKKLIFINH
ncbi:MAG: M14 family zinc carboxypeptidase [bacterium]|nr:M14 family zinc carboxypeptidase [bacterium]